MQGNEAELSARPIPPVMHLTLVPRTGLLKLCRSTKHHIDLIAQQKRANECSVAMSVEQVHRHQTTKLLHTGIPGCSCWSLPTKKLTPAASACSSANRSHARLERVYGLRSKRVYVLRTNTQWSCCMANDFHADCAQELNMNLHLLLETVLS